MSNLRSWPLIVPEETELEAWLEAQSDDVKKVTFYDPEQNMLFQVPHIEEGAFVDPSALLIGGMIVKRGCYIGPYAVIRLDEVEAVDPLIIGESSNIQDCAVVHSTTTQIGSRVIVAHQAIVHGAHVEDDVTIYIQATVDGGGTVIGRGSFLHQGSYVGKGIKVHPGSYVAPGVKVTTQAQADALPQIPEELKRIRATVLEHNQHHSINHTNMHK